MGYLDEIQSKSKSAYSELYDNKDTKGKCAIPSLPPDLQSSMNKAMDFVDEIQESELFTCDALCQRNKKLNELKDKMIKAQNVYRDSPSQLDVAEKNYYTFKNSSQWYKNWKDKKDNEYINRDIKLYKNPSIRDEHLKNQQESKNKQIVVEKTLNTFLSDLERLYKDKIKQELINRDKTVEKSRIADRLSFYQKKDTDYISIINQILFYCFLFFIILYSIIFLYIHEEYMNPTLYTKRFQKISLMFGFAIIWYILYFMYL